MVQAYNFLASWQLFPEKCYFQFGTVPKSGNYKIEGIDNNLLSINSNWVAQTNDAFYTQYSVQPNGIYQPFANEELADQIKAVIPNTSTMITTFSKNDTVILEVTHEILANGYLKIIQKGIDEHQQPFENIEIYHKQMSVLPYASSLTGVAIKPTNEGMIKHKALAAMEEQTNMQLNQIKQQIELLAKQAQEINKRKELSHIIYEAALKFKPQIGHTYHLYEQRNGSYMLSLVSPNEWGGSMPYKQCLASVKLLADHTWVEV